MLIRKLYTLELSHQLLSAHSKDCSDTIHGHSYTVEVFLYSNKLNRNGMVKDFGALSEVKKWLMGFDHALVMGHPGGLEDSSKQAAYAKYLNELKKHNKKFRIMPAGSPNPTAECMCVWWLDQLHAVEPLVCGIRIHETATGYAELGVTHDIPACS